MKRILSSLVALSFAGVMTLAASAQTGVQSGENSQNSNHSTANSKTSAAGMTMSDDAFVKKAAEADMAEVELGHLAVQKASSEKVKNFGQRMIDDHGKNQDKVKQVAEEEHVTLPTQLSAKDQATKERLEKLSGTQFDDAYMKDMLKNHKKDVAEFAHESKDAKDSAVKNYAQETLPTLREHLSLAKQIAPIENTRANNAGNSMR
ncbi:MAG TPA: DUF4142 domain-containing protein [Candidatus Eisenbacteria bacterium]|nr:DUF4142 domain-containing protein [Candidatus Eisenbacteria bacterium]